MKKYLYVMMALGGCSTYDTKFDCPAGPGLSCTSLSRVDQMIDRGDLKHADSSTKKGVEVYLPPAFDERGNLMDARTISLGEV